MYLLLASIGSVAAVLVYCCLNISAPQDNKEEDKQQAEFLVEWSQKHKNRP